MGTVFTIGLMWTVEDIKKFNADWMNFNNGIFNSGSVLADTLMTAVPALSGIGYALFIIAWILLAVGFKKDKDEGRHKNYKGFLIAFIFITILFIAVSIFALVASQSSK